MVRQEALQKLTGLERKELFMVGTGKCRPLLAILAVAVAISIVGLCGCNDDDKRVYIPPPNQPPTVEITGGPSGTTNDSTPRFTFKFRDSDGYVSKFACTIDDPNFDNPYIDTPWVPGDPGDPYVYGDWTSPQLEDGPHTFYLQAKDNNGAYSSVATRSFVVDAGSGNQPPTVTITGGPGASTNDDTPTFTWQGSDPDGSVDGYWVSIDDPTPSIVVGTATSWTSFHLLDGTHTFYVQAWDNQGAESTVKSRSFTVNTGSGNQPPTVEITGGPSGTTNDSTPTFSYSGSDPDGSIAGYWVSIGTSPPDIWTTSTSWTSPALADGAYVGP
jgi:hypothetical protein